MKNEICKLKSDSDELFNSIYQMIKFFNLENEEKFNRQVKLYNNSDFLYNHLRQIIPSKDIYTIDTNNGFEKNAKKINHLFYEGFGIEI